MSFVGIILGMCFSMIFSTGLISLGVAAFYAVGAYSSVILTVNYNFNFWVAFPLSFLAAGIVAILLGAMIIRYPGVSFVVMTFIFNLFVVQITGQIDYLGGWGGIIGIPQPNSVVIPFYGTLEFVSKKPYYYFCLSLFLLIAGVFHAVYTSRVGRAWKAIKLSPALAQSLGINVYKFRLLSFVIASSVAGGIGSFYAHYFQAIVPDAFSVWTSVYIQLYSVLGGLDFTLLGPTIGATLMTFLPEFLRAAREVEPLFTGALLILIIIFFPGGILGTLINIKYYLSSFSFLKGKLARPRT
jgi:branched-chain amino acid transport system permease protein